MKDDLSILKLVKEAIDENRGVDDGLKRTVKMMRKWAEEDIATFTSVSPERDAKFQQALAEAVEAHRLIEEHEAKIAALVASAPARFKYHTRVRVVGEQIDWRGETKVPVGLVGTVASQRQVPAVPAGHTAVSFRASDLGYMMDDDYPLDHPENTMTFYLWNFTLEAAEEGAMSVVPEPRKWVANPAPEGHRWAIMYESDGVTRELGGHCCCCHEEMVEYTQKIMGRVEAIEITETNTPSYLGGGIRF
ncbi:MAG: hypothetical protein DI537_46565 [Stutzerimonas stutzeri]|nr:MAG: hypothetical protein DI537_46565 [Stutzerimonas stutzeri]